MTQPIAVIKQQVRRGANWLARRLDHLTGGRITPDAVTYAGLAMHLPIAWFIATGHDLWAAGFLIVFGLFDTLDGELARYQQRSGPRGMLLDASTDRMKEVMIFSGAAYALAQSGQPATAAWAAAAVGASLCVSYVKAKGEAAVAAASKKIPHAELNRMFADGILTFEIRMAVMVAGLLFDKLLWAVAVVAVLAALTAVQRLVTISRRL